MPPVELTQEQIDQLTTAGFLAPPATAGFLAPSATADVAPPAAAPAPDIAPPAAAPVAPVSAIAVGDVVSQNTSVGWRHELVTRYGIVVAVDEPVIVGANDDGTDKLVAHAAVAWLGGDSSTVALDELTPIG